MKPEEIEEVWRGNLAQVARAHAEGLDRWIVEGIARAARDRRPPKVPARPADLAGVLEWMRVLNFCLWHIEDEARRVDVDDAYVAATKRWIDPHNQARNDSMEAIDEHLAARFPLPSAAPLHTETPGVAFDRLSVLALKIHHTREESSRSDAEEGYRAKMRERLAKLEAQGEDLRSALRSLLDDLAAGRRSFRMYRQFKLYNDPESNPAVRGRGA